MSGFSPFPRAFWGYTVVFPVAEIRLRADLQGAFRVGTSTQEGSRLRLLGPDAMRPRVRIGRLLVISGFVVTVSLPSKADIPKTPATSPYVAPEDHALIVFVRPRKRLAEEVMYSVVDERGRCIAVLGNDWKVVGQLRPGRQRLMVITGVAQPQVQLLKVKAEAGRTYVVKLRPRVNARNPVEMTVVRRPEQPLELFPASVVQTNPFRPDLADCTAWVAARRSKLASKASRARTVWNEDEAMRQRQTIQPADGWTREEVTAAITP